MNCIFSSDRWVEIPSDRMWTFADDMNLLGHDSTFEWTSRNRLEIAIEKLDPFVNPKDRVEKVRDPNYVDNLKCGDIIDVRVALPFALFFSIFEK